MTSATSTHTIQIDTPTWGDYLKGGYGDFVAQCSCGQYEYVSSHEEGMYWHWLHRTNLNLHWTDLLHLLVNNPMPAEWSEPAAPVPSLASSRLHTCASCAGSGSTLIGGGGLGNGRFYNYGSCEAVPCPDCGGLGLVDPAQARLMIQAKIQKAA